ncbi:hypothetical protein [Bremerella volcania]|nr:hypothetical protein [Bremerella volcania]
MSTLNFPLTLLILGLFVGCNRSPQATIPPKSNAVKSVSIAPETNKDSSDPIAQSLPPAIYQDSDGSVRLSPLTAKVLGEGLDLNEWDQIAGFKSRDQRVLWQIHLSAPGTYQVEVDAICTGPTQEARMRVYFGNNRYLEDDIQLSDNDQMLATTSLGEITLDAPKEYQVEIEMVGLPLIGKFAVSELRLVPLGENPTSFPKFKTDDGLTEGN